MLSIGAFEAKTHLSSLLERVSKGEEVIITKHGRPVARLVSALAREPDDHREAFAALRDLRRTATLAGVSWKDLRDEGRR